MVLPGHHVPSVAPEGGSSRIVASLKALRNTAGSVYTSSQDELNPAEDTLSSKDQSARNDWSDG
jgi:hypothetical protein